MDEQRIIPLEERSDNDPVKGSILLPQMLGIALFQGLRIRPWKQRVSMVSGFAVLLPGLLCRCRSRQLSATRSRVVAWIEVYRFSMLPHVLAIRC